MMTSQSLSTAFTPAGGYCDWLLPVAMFSNWRWSDELSRVTLNYFLIGNGENDEKAFFSISNADKR